MTDGDGLNEVEFDDDLDEDETDEEVDEEALRQAGQAAGTFSDDPDIDSPAPAGGSQAPDLTDGPTPEPAALDEVLAGNAPMLLMHKSHHHAPFVPLALGVARRVTQGRIGLGTVIRLPRCSPTNAATYLSWCTHAQLRLADPEIYALPGTGAPGSPVSARYQEHYPWSVGMPDANATATERLEWVRGVLDAQHAAGATILLSASGWVSDQQAQASLKMAMGWVAESRAALEADDLMFVNLTLAGGWLANPALRAMLLDELVESSEPLWYVRVYWPIIEPRFGQLTDAALLDGYKDLAQVARQEGKVLVLPNSGLTGWVATALGASGFSTGIGWAEQAYAAQRIYANRPSQPRPERIQRYFDRTVLHPLTWLASEAMTDVPGHLGCTCRFCAQMRTENAWHPGQAGGHYLVRAARLTAEIATSNRRREARQLVADAQQFVAGVGSQHWFTGAYNPQHLAAWAARL